MSAFPAIGSKKAILPPDEQPAALVVFDLLIVSEHDLRERPLTDRRAALEHVLEAHPFPSSTLRISEQVAGDGRALHARAKEQGWEGLLVKQARSPYRTGRRSPEWRKLKLQHVDEFVVCGYTEPQGARAGFGALILGARTGDTAKNGTLSYVGDVGTGFNGDEIDRLWGMLQRLATKASPFADTPSTLARRAHWVTPTLVAQVRYTEITDEGRLRHPAYLGLRDDKTAAEVVAPAALASRAPARPSSRDVLALAPPPKAPQVERYESRLLCAVEGHAGLAPSDRGQLQTSRETTTRCHGGHPQLERNVSAARSARRPRTIEEGWPADPARRRHARTDEPRQGVLAGDRKDEGRSAAALRAVAPLILPVIKDRPLVMKRLPNGVTGKAFYQHRAPEPVPPGIRAETLPDDDVPARLVGGSLKTLLYMAQIASISMDPFFSTVQALDYADQVAIDLDPQPGATFPQILDVARWVHEILERVNVRGYPKTSGSEGLHIFIPLPPGTPYEAGMLFCQIVATMVATQHPKVATVQRMVNRRKDGTIYVDYLQNIQGKTLACAYSARASAFAGVSAPLTWKELDEGPMPQDFTIDTIAARLDVVGDLWADLRADKGANLLAAIDKLS